MSKEINANKLKFSGTVFTYIQLTLQDLRWISLDLNTFT